MRKLFSLGFYYIRFRRQEPASTALNLGEANHREKNQHILLVKKIYGL